MLKSKKVIALLSALSLSGFAFADAELSFKNEVSSDIVNIVSEKDSEGKVSTKTEFAGIKNKTVVDFSSEKVDAGIDIRFFLNNKDSVRPSNGENYTYTFIGGNAYSVNMENGEITPSFYIKDYYIEYRPVEILTIGFHDTINTEASYLPIWDDNASTGNFGSDFTVCLRPVNGLRIATGFDFMSYFGMDADETDVNGQNGFIWNSGIDYTIEDLFSIGFTARNVLSKDRAFGFYSSLSAVEGLNLGLGFGINESGIGEYELSGNILMLGASYENEDAAMNFALDFATNFGNDQSEKDLYLAASWGWDFADDWALNTEVITGWNLNEADSGEYILHPFATWSHEIHSIEAGLQVQFNENSSTVCFPVKYTIEF